jgi:flavodoxin
MAEKRALVVYYSRTGTTRGVAETLAQKLDADLEEIVDRKRRGGVIGFMGGGKDALLKKVADIDEPRKDPAEYQLVLLGTPVWAGSVTPAVRAYIELKAASLPDVAFFLTTGGSGIDKTFQAMAELCGKQPQGTLGLKERDVKKGAAGDAIDGFVATLRADWDTAEMPEE